MKKLNQTIKATVIASALVMPTVNLQAQGFLKKLKESASQLSDQVAAGNYDPNKGLKVSDKWYAEQKADAAKTDLDSKVKKDEWGFSGVYYCKDLMMTSSERGKVSNAVGKVLLTYDFGKNGTMLTIQSSYHLDAANGLVTYKVDRSGYKFELEHRNALGLKMMYHSGSVGIDERNVFYIAANHPFVNNEGKVVQNKEITLKPIGSVTAVLIEPGIVLLTDGGALMYVPKGGRDADDVAKEKLQPIVCLYTKEKEAKAMKMTQEEMYQ
jgi:hypothetical protein